MRAGSEGEVLGAPDTTEDVCVIVPMYNEGGAIADVISALLDVFPRVVCVDDGSTDSSIELARAAGATVLRHHVNLGQGAALRTGITHALIDPRNRYVVTFDADGQHDVADAAKLVGAARIGNVDVVLGSRFLGVCESIPRRRRLLLRAALLFTRLTTRLRITDTHNGLRVFSRSAAAAIQIQQSGMAHASEILAQIARLRLTYVEHPVTIRYSEHSRTNGQSGLNAINIVHELFIAKLRTAP